MTSAIGPAPGMVIVASWRKATFAPCGKPPPDAPPADGLDADVPVPLLLEGALGLQAAKAKTETKAKAAIRIGTSANHHGVAAARRDRNPLSLDPGRKKSPRGNWSQK